MTEAVHVVPNKSIKDLSIRCFKLSLMYGRNLVCENMVLDIRTGIVTINDNGIFIVGKFDFTEFNFGEWQNAPSGSKERGSYVLSDESVKPPVTEAVCLQIEQKDSFSGYNSFKALFSNLPKSLVDAKITLSPEKFSMMEKQNGEDPEPQLIEIILKSLGKGGLLTYEKFGLEGEKDMGPEIVKELEELKKHTISDETGSRNAGARGGQYSPGETIQQRLESRVKTLENIESMDRMAKLLTSINRYCMTDPAVYGPPLTMNDFLWIMLQ